MYLASIDTCTDPESLSQALAELLFTEEMAFGNMAVKWYLHMLTIIVCLLEPLIIMLCIYTFVFVIVIVAVIIIFYCSAPLISISNWSCPWSKGKQEVGNKKSQNQCEMQAVSPSNCQIWAWVNSWSSAERTIVDSNELYDYVHVVLPNLYCECWCFLNGCVHHLVKVWLILYDIMHVHYAKLAGCMHDC